MALKWGRAVTYRAIAAVLTLMLGGCASEAVSTSLATAPQYLGASVSDEVSALPASRSFGKPLSSRVLSAIAFERTTGFEAHPSRIIADE